ncbi:Dbl homology domain-containing protein, partial [Piromyces finnis]
MNSVLENTIKPELGKENKKAMNNDFNKKNSYHEVVKVLYLSEFQYVNNIKILIEKVKYPIQYSIKHKKPILLQKDLDLILKGIPEIFQLSWCLCKDFKKALKTIDPNDFTCETIANIFLDYAKKFEVYIKYISYFSISSTAIKRLSSERPIFRNFLNSLKKKKALGKFNDIQNILELPIERIEKYINILHIVQKITLNQQQSNEIIDEAILFMKDLKDDLSKASEREKELQNLYTFKNSIDNCPSSLVLSSRKLIKTFDNLLDIETFINMKVAIFSDLIVFSRFNKKTNRYAFKKMVDFRILDVDEDSSSEYDSEYGQDNGTYSNHAVVGNNNSDNVITFYFQSMYRYSSRNDYSIVITNDYEDYSSIIENTTDISFIRQLNSTP